MVSAEGVRTMREEYQIELLIELRVWCKKILDDLCFHRYIPQVLMQSPDMIPGGFDGSIRTDGDGAACEKRSGKRAGPGTDIQDGDTSRIMRPGEIEKMPEHEGVFFRESLEDMERFNIPVERDTSHTLHSPGIR